MKKILFVSPWQFGSHTVSMYYAKYLSRKFDVTYFSLDEDKEKIDYPKIKTKYCKIKRGNYLLSKLQFIYYVLNEIGFQKYDLVFVKYFPFCSLLKIFKSKNKFLLDIRSGSVLKKKINNYIYNRIIYLDSFFFNNITIITSGLGKQLFLPDKKLHVLPLGANVDEFISKKKTDDILTLVYVGTLTNRRVEDTIFAMNYLSKNTLAKINYVLIVKGSDFEIDAIKGIINSSIHADRIRLHFNLSPEEVKTKLSTANIGISYFPIEDYYQFQPPIKTFEYLFFGLPVIAVDTFAHREIINDTNGILSKDNKMDFANCVEKIVSRIHCYDKTVIINSVKEYNYENIVIKNLIPYLKDKIFVE